MANTPDVIGELVERFGRNLAAYKSPQYNETELRVEFVNPFWSALGWDMENKAGSAMAYRDVIHEDALKVGTATKAPDYCFRIGGMRKFFLETKRPSINLKTDPMPAYQLRRYGWSAKLPLSVLTDFEELIIYDCRLRPRKTDKASQARILCIHFKDYPAKWEEFTSIFSREAILKGSFDKFAETTKGKRGTAEVDTEFLKEIEGWREALARNIALRNPKLTAYELNFAIQMTIDRIIFLRMCEDRGIEHYGQLQALCGGQRIYPRMLQIYRKADERYNSGLFHFEQEKDQSSQPDELTPRLIIDDKVLKDILSNLYYPDSPYEFRILPPEILGNVYEQFLGKVIRLTTGHQAKIEEKPEVRKAGGVYYTPSYIVDYIVKNTVGKLLEDIISRKACQARVMDAKSPSSAILRDVAKLRILDPACGSGSFLLGAYQYLLDWHLKAYITEKEKTGKIPTIPPETGKRRRKSDAPVMYQGQGGDWLLTTVEKKRILLSNIYGVDIDPQAVEVTKLSLLLKVLENENQDSLHNQLTLWRERALPDLSGNIKCGNSLIGPDFYQNRQMDMFNDKDKYHINAFDWNEDRQGFGTIIRADGFDAVIGNPPWGAEFKEHERAYLIGRYPLVPSKTKDSYLFFISQSIKLLQEKGRLGFIVPNTWLLINTAKEFRKYLLSLELKEIIDHGDGVFSRATVESATIILIKAPNTTPTCHAIRLRKGDIVADHHVDKRIWLEDDYCRIIIDMDRKTSNLLKRLRANNDPFHTNCVIVWGIKPYQIGYGLPPQTPEMVQNRIYHANIKRGQDWKPLLVGSDVNRYMINFPGDQFIKYGKWLMYHSNEQLMLGPKILMRQTSDILRCCYDKSSFYCQNSVFIIHSLNINLKYLLGLLNSKLLRFVYKYGNPQTGKVFAEIKPSVIKELPIHSVDNSNHIDKSRHDRMVTLVDSMLDLHKKVQAAKTPNEKTRLERQISATDKQIDELVYNLYDLTEEEIKIVEGSLKP